MKIGGYKWAGQFRGLVGTDRCFLHNHELYVIGTQCKYDTSEAFAFKNSVRRCRKEVRALVLKYKAPEAGGGPTEHDAPQLLVVARQLLESHPTVLTFKTRSRSDTAVETRVVEAALELSGSGVINLLHDLDIDASIGLNGEHYIGRLVSLFYLFLFSPSPPPFSLS